MTTNSNLSFKLANLEGGDLGRPAIVIGESVYDLGHLDHRVERSPSTAEIVLPTNNRELIEDYQRSSKRLSEITAGILSSGYPKEDLAESSLCAPILYPWNLIGVAVNYRAHGEEMDRQIDEEYSKDAPYLFTKSPRACLKSTGEELVIPKGHEKIDWELELAAIIGKRATAVHRDVAEEYLWGFGLILDISDRQMLERNNAFFNVDWFNAKSKDGFAPMGPYIVPVEFIPNYSDLHMELRVNDEVMQDYNTRHMTHNVEELIEFITSIHTLEPGDIIATGTPPGVGKGRTPPVFLKPGDIITAEIEGVCSINTPVV